jgi:hypothetical protein
MGRFDKLTSLSDNPTQLSAPRVVPDPVPVPVPDPTPVFKKRLIVRRYPVDPYEDQVAALDTLSTIEKEQGLTGSRAAMVRDALDLYFTLRPIFDSQRGSGFRGTITELLKDILQSSSRGTQ